MSHLNKKHWCFTTSESPKKKDAESACPSFFHRTNFSHLILFQAALLHHLIPLFLEGDDDESHEDVDEEEWKDDKVDDVEDGHLHPVAVARTPVLFCHIYRVLQDPGRAETRCWLMLTGMLLKAQALLRAENISNCLKSFTKSRLLQTLLKEEVLFNEN